MAQLQQFAHGRAVVVLRLAQVAGAGGVGGVELLAQRAVFAVLHHREIAREVQRQLVAWFAVGFGGRAGGVFGVGGHTGQLFFGDIEREAVSRVHHMFGERLRQGGLPLLDLRIALAGSALQLGP